MAEVSLSVVLHLAVTHRALMESGELESAQAILGLSLPHLKHSIARVGPGSQISPDPFGAPMFDVYRIGSKEDLRSDEWVLFYDRFRRSAENGIKGRMYRAISGVLGEMGDNVVWHAFEAENMPCPALAGFYVAGDAASFCVADCGQGFLQSLKRSSSWARLRSDSEALDAVVNKRATSRQGETEGGGFKQLFNSLLDFNGLAILRSGSCTFRLENCGDVRRLTVREGMAVSGSAVTVVVSRRGNPAELPLKMAT